MRPRPQFPSLPAPTTDRERIETPTKSEQALIGEQYNSSPLKAHQEQQSVIAKEAEREEQVQNSEGGQPASSSFWSRKGKRRRGMAILAGDRSGKDRLLRADHVKERTKQYTTCGSRSQHPRIGFGH